MIVQGDAVAAFVADQLSTAFEPPYSTIGLAKHGEVIAGVVFNHWEGPDIHVTIAGHGWTRGILAEVGHYVFGQLRCQRMTAITEKPEIVRLGERLGGQIEGCLRNHFGLGRHGFIVGILKQEYRF